MDEKTFLHNLILVDRWKPKFPTDPLINFHIKVKDYNINTKIVTYSWWDGTKGYEDELSFEEFEKRFEKKY